MSDAWAKALAELAALLKKWGAAFSAFMGGYFTRKAQEDKADKKALENELDAERKANDIISDPDERERLRNRWKDHE